MANDGQRILGFHFDELSRILKGERAHKWLPSDAKIVCCRELFDSNMLQIKYTSAEAKGDMLPGEPIPSMHYYDDYCYPS